MGRQQSGSLMFFSPVWRPATDAGYRCGDRPVVEVNVAAQTILCFGDSNTYGYVVETGGRFPRDVRWPGVLQGVLGGEYVVIEEGLPGRTSNWDDPFGAGLNGRPYLGPCLASHAPVDLVVVMLGTNDLKRYFRVKAPEIALGVGALVDVALYSGCGPAGQSPAVLIVTPPPLGKATKRSLLWGFGKARKESLRLAEHYATVAELRECPVFDAATVASVDPADGVHLDADSHKRLGTALADEVRRILGTS
jgi:lysophospholipase L1-like esterase